MPRSIAIVLWVLVGLSSVAQGVTGQWTGESIQGRNSRFLFQMDLVENDDGSITGINTISIPGQPHLYAIMEMRGQRRGDRSLFQEIRILEERVERFYWCIKGGPLLLDTTAGIWRMHGPWEAPNCVDGRLVVYRIEPHDHGPRNDEREYLELLGLREPRISAPLQRASPRACDIAWIVRGRAVRYDRAISANTDSLLVLLQDDKRADGDTVSLYLNGTCIAVRIAVPHRRNPRVLTIHLSPGVNHLVMFAENLGSIPPNTAALSFVDAGRQYRIVLASSMHHSEGIVIDRSDPFGSSRSGP